MTSGAHHAERRIAAVADAVEEIFRKGIHLSDTVVHYLSSTYDISSPEALFHILTPPFDCDAESICDMVFYPDESQQLLLEPVLEENPVENDREKNALADILTKRSIDTTLYFPSGPQSLRIEIPGTALRRFIHRINPDRRIDPQIIRAMDENIPSPQIAATLKVTLRNTRFSLDKNRVSVICDFLANIETHSPSFMELFALFCQIIEDANTEDLYISLIKAKQRRMEMLRLAEKNETDLKGQPVEALMMKGSRIAAVNAEEVRRQIDFIDRISIGMFGKTETLPLAGQEETPSVNLGVYKRKGDDLDRVIKILS